jgi:hypothetical protein
VVEDGSELKGDCGRILTGWNNSYRSMECSTNLLIAAAVPPEGDLEKLQFI